MSYKRIRHDNSWTPDTSQTDYRAAPCWETLAGSSGGLSVRQTWDEDEYKITPEYIAVGLQAGHNYSFSFSSYYDGIAIYDTNGAHVCTWSVYEEDEHQIISRDGKGWISFTPAETNVYLLYNYAEGNDAIITASEPVDTSLASWVEYPRSVDIVMSPLKKIQSWKPDFLYRNRLIFAHDCRDLLNPSKGGKLQQAVKNNTSTISAAYRTKDGLRYLVNRYSILCNHTFPAIANMDFTVLCWALFLEPVDYCLLGFGDDSANFNIGTLTNNGKAYFSINGETGNYAVNVPLGKWFPFAVTYKHSTQTATACDLRGVPLFTRSGALASNAGIAIGKNYAPTNSANSSGGALIANIAVYSMVLPAVSIYSVLSLFPIKYK